MGVDKQQFYERTQSHLNALQVRIQIVSFTWLAMIVSMMRTVLSTAAGFMFVLASGFAFLAVHSPFRAWSAANKNQIYVNDLQIVARRVASDRIWNGAELKEKSLICPAYTSEESSALIHLILVDTCHHKDTYITGSSLNKYFKPAKKDDIVLSYWSGDYFEFYSYPSGLTTLRTSWWSIMTDGGEWLFLLVFIVLSAGFGFGGIWCWRRM